MAIIMPSIDISNGKAVKRVRGERGTGIVIGDPLKIAEELYSRGYSHVHVVDLDAAEGVGNNEDLVRRISEIGFKWVQVGGGIRDRSKASRLLACGASAVVISSIYFKNKSVFDEILRHIGEDKVILALDYKSDGYVYLSGWKERGPKLDEVLSGIQSYNLLGVLFTYIDGEGLMRGIDRSVVLYAKRVRGLKEYAGGVSSLSDVEFLGRAGFHYVVVGMAFYRGLLG